ncbi:MAG: histidine phosphatase family protein [Solobacterium sp.]|nr:histidine phosphatase family protein [Solobacterium sp.]
MRVYILRHGQTDKNKEKVLQGRSDLPLNEEGRQQAEETGAYFRQNGISFDRVYSSPLSRAVQTAEQAAPGHDVLKDERLLEMDYGPYEGSSLTSPAPEIVEFFRDFVHHPAPEGMESLASVTARLGTFLDELAGTCGPSENILISTHAIAMKGALEYLMPESKGSWWSTYIGNCAVYMAEYRNGAYSAPKEINIKARSE